MDDKQAMHAMSIDDAYHVERTLAREPSGVTELVSIDGNGPFVRKKIPSPLAQRNVWAALSACQSNRLPRVEATYELPDRFVIVYDYVPGSTLAQIAEENGRLAPNVAVQLIDQICEAVQELHQHGVIHRDITPANVIVAQDGAHLIDFGIARIRSEASNRSRDTTALGTYGFASPEQYGFAKTDARSDVFSLGRLLGFMLTGVYPDASDYEQRLADDAAVPARLRAVIGYACAFEPSKRPQSVQEFHQALFSQSNPPIPNASSANPPSTRTTNGSASASRLFRRLHLSKRAIVLWSIAGAALIIAAIAGGIVLAGQLGIIGSATSPDSSTQSSSQSTDKADGGHSSNGSGTDNANGTGGVGGTDGADGDNQDTVTDNPLKIVESGWSADQQGYVHYAFALRNTSKTQQVQYPQITITGRAKDGSIVFSQTQALNMAFPNQTVYDAGQAGEGTAPETVDFTVLNPDTYNVAKAQGTAAFPHQWNIQNRQQGRRHDVQWRGPRRGRWIQAIRWAANQDFPSTAQRTERNHLWRYHIRGLAGQWPIHAILDHRLRSTEVCILRSVCANLVVDFAPARWLSGDCQACVRVTCALVLWRAWPNR